MKKKIDTQRENEIMLGPQGARYRKCPNYEQCSSIIYIEWHRSEQEAKQLNGLCKKCNADKGVQKVLTVSEKSARYDVLRILYLQKSQKDVLEMAKIFFE